MTMRLIDANEAIKIINHAAEVCNSGFTRSILELVAVRVEALKTIEAEPVATDANVGSKWIPVTERLPVRDEKCLCRYTFGEREMMCFYQVLDYYATDPQPHFKHTLGDSKMRVTHWMPLPKPPEIKEA